MPAIKKLTARELYQVASRLEMFLFDAILTPASRINISKAITTIKRAASKRK